MDHAWIYMWSVIATLAILFTFFVVLFTWPHAFAVISTFFALAAIVFIVVEVSDYNPPSGWIDG